MTHTVHPETIERLQRYASRQPEPASDEDVEASLPDAMEQYRGHYYAGRCICRCHTGLGYLMTPEGCGHCDRGEARITAPGPCPVCSGQRRGPDGTFTIRQPLWDYVVSELRAYAELDCNRPAVMRRLADEVEREARR